MARDPEDPEWARLQQRIAELLAPFAPMFGARRCAHEEDWGDCEEDHCTFSMSEPKPGAMPVIQHWLLIAATTDMNGPANERPTQVAIDGTNQPGYVTRGLAHDYLDN